MKQFFYRMLDFSKAKYILNKKVFSDILKPPQMASEKVSKCPLHFVCIREEGGMSKLQSITLDKGLLTLTWEQ